MIAQVAVADVREIQRDAFAQLTLSQLVRGSFGSSSPVPALASSRQLVLRLRKLGGAPPVTQSANKRSQAVAPLAPCVTGRQARFRGRG